MYCSVQSIYVCHFIRYHISFRFAFKLVEAIPTQKSFPPGFSENSMSMSHSLMMNNTMAMNHGMHNNMSDMNRTMGHNHHGNDMSGHMPGHHDDMHSHSIIIFLHQMLV